jgi:hypothetical protein
LNDDIFEESAAFEAGCMAYTGGFPQNANYYYQEGFKHWAWDLGWREQEFIAERAREFAEEEMRRVESLSTSKSRSRNSVFGGLR